MFEDAVLVVKNSRKRKIHPNGEEVSFEGELADQTSKLVQSNDEGQLIDEGDPWVWPARGTAVEGKSLNW